MSNNQDMCPICTQPFQKEEVLVRYLTWGENHHLEKLGHLDCVYVLSNAENRRHPPTLNVRVAELEKGHSRAVKELGARITKLGG